MVNLAALILVVMTGQQPGPPVDAAPHARHAQIKPAATARRLTPEQKAWFARSIDHILTGK